MIALLDKSIRRTIAKNVAIIWMNHYYILRSTSIILLHSVFVDHLQAVLTLDRPSFFHTRHLFYIFVLVTPSTFNNIVLSLSLPISFLVFSFLYGCLFACKVALFLICDAGAVYLVISLLVYALLFFVVLPLFLYCCSCMMVLSLRALTCMLFICFSSFQGLSR